MSKTAKVNVNFGMIQQSAVINWLGRLTESSSIPVLCTSENLDLDLKPEVVR